MRLTRLIPMFAAACLAAPGGRDPLPTPAPRHAATHAPRRVLRHPFRLAPVQPVALRPATSDQRGVLTIAEVPRPGMARAAVNFVQVGRHVRFHVDTGLIGRAGLRLSSRLLRLAIRVTP